jgi:hypothetical protein
VHRKGSPPYIKVAIKNVGKRQVTLISGSFLPHLCLLCSSFTLSRHTLLLPSVSPLLYADARLPPQATNPGPSSPLNPSPKTSNTSPPPQPRFSRSPGAQRRAKHRWWRSCVKVRLLSILTLRSELTLFFLSFSPCPPSFCPPFTLPSLFFPSQALTMLSSSSSSPLVAFRSATSRSILASRRSKANEAAAAQG